MLDGFASGGAGFLAERNGSQPVAGVDAAEFSGTFRSRGRHPWNPNRTSDYCEQHRPEAEPACTIVRALEAPSETPGDDTKRPERPAWLSLSVSDATPVVRGNSSLNHWQGGMDGGSSAVARPSADVGQR